VIAAACSPAVAVAAVVSDLYEDSVEAIAQVWIHVI